MRVRTHDPIECSLYMLANACLNSRFHRVFFVYVGKCVSELTIPLSVLCICWQMRVWTHDSIECCLYMLANACQNSRSHRVFFVYVGKCVSELTIPSSVLCICWNIRVWTHDPIEWNIIVSMCETVVVQGEMCLDNKYTKEWPDHYTIIFILFLQNDDIL